MKKIIAFALAAVLLFSLAACADDGAVSDYEENVEPAQDVQSLSDQVGVSMTVPATAKNVECSIINNIVGRITFSFNSIIYEYRSSKLLSGRQLSKKTYSDSTRSDISIGDRASLQLYTDGDGGRIAVWSLEGTNYSLYCRKNISNDALTELCDLLIPQTTDK